MEQDVNEKVSDTVKNEAEAVEKKAELNAKMDSKSREEKKGLADIEKKKLEEWWQKMETEEGAQELRAKAEAKVGSCPVCKGKHEYQRRLPGGALS